jgi:hypothetical protein
MPASAFLKWVSGASIMYDRWKTRSACDAVLPTQRNDSTRKEMVAHAAQRVHTVISE